MIGLALAALAALAAAAAPAAAPEGMALIPGGTFYMGSPEGQGYPNERPRHEIRLDAFWIDRTEVTAARYRPFAGKAGLALRRQPYPDETNHPVVNVAFEDALAYCRSLGRRLPTEAEWERAARGGSSGDYAFGDDAGKLGEYAWYWDNSGERIHPVAQKKPNAYGLYDMHGNVLEWTADWYAEDYYKSSPRDNPRGPAKGEARSVRGGSAFVTARHLRSAQRMKGAPTNPYSGRGFRCAADVVRP